MRKNQSVQMFFLLLIVWNTALQAQILDRITLTPIPGTQGITPGPGVNLFRKSLPNALLANFNLASAELSNANLAGASFANSNLDFSHAESANLENVDFSGASLRSAYLYRAKLTGARFQNADITNAFFSDVTSRGFSVGQLYSTKNYLEKVLAGNFSRNDFSNGGFRGQTLLIEAASTNFTGADFRNARMGGTYNSAIFRNADFTDAEILRADLTLVTQGGFTADQLYSTASYKQRKLDGIQLSGNDLRGWDFSNQSMVEARLEGVALKLAGSNWSAADLRGAYLTRFRSSGANLRGANLSRAIITDSLFGGADLTNADLRFTFYYGAANSFVGANLTNVDMRGAALPQYVNLDETGIVNRNLIRPDGVLTRLELTSGETRTINDGNYRVSTFSPPLPGIQIKERMQVDEGGTLRMEFGNEPWQSVISFAPNATVELQGNLEVGFAPNLSGLSAYLGRSFQLFDWKNAQRIGEFTVSTPPGWDFSRLYTQGVVRFVQLHGLLADDYNGDHKVDLADFAILKANYGKRGGVSKGDSDRNGRIDLVDFGLLRSQINRDATLAVPEPSTNGWVWAAAALAILCRIRPSAAQ